MKRRDIARLLPEVFQRTLPEEWWQENSTGMPANLLGAFLTGMENLHGEAEETLEHPEYYLDPVLCQEKWLPFLAGWLDFARFLKHEEKRGWVFPGGSQRLRQLILEAPALNRERGTLPGLRRFLRIATGIDAIVISYRDRQYHMTVTCPPPDYASYGMPEAVFLEWLQELVEAEKPAYVTYEINICDPTGEPPA